MVLKKFLFAAITLTFFLLICWIFDRTGSTVKSAPPLPSQFEETLVANVIAPTAIAFTPDERLLITTQLGALRIYKEGSLLPTPAIDLGSRICANSERGLLGVAVDPEFASNGFLYLYYTFNKNNACPTNDPNNPRNPVNRVSRFILGADNLIDPASETVLIDNIHSPAGNHNAGDLQFGKDGYLYISVGDGGSDYAGDSGTAGENDAALDNHVLLGKILRVTRDGLIPPTNPFQGVNSDRCNVTGQTTSGNVCQEIYATGLRNPFRMAFDPNAPATRFLINDVGQNVWEEIDEGAAGADYGWNMREGHCANDSRTNCGAPPAGLTNPIFDYPHTDCNGDGVAGNSITGGAFVPKGVWPEEYDGAYLFGEYVCGKIFRITPNPNGGYAASVFAPDLWNRPPVSMIFGPDQGTLSLFYTTYSEGGQIRLIRFTGSTNRLPIAIANADPASGSAPLTVAFDASDSSDPDDDPLSFSWNFGDNSTGAGALVSHQYVQAGTYSASVTVTDGRGGSATAIVRIDVGDTPPVASIASPTGDQLFRVGETITLTGGAIDPEEGPLDPSRLTWQVLLHHNNDHTHPYFGPQAGNNLTFNAPPPEDLPAAVGSFLEIRLTATDSKGLSGKTVVQYLQPRKARLTFATNPGALGLTANGFQLAGPQTITSWDGYPLTIDAPDQIDAQGASWSFVSWSDGGVQTHTIVTPAEDATYTANFTGRGAGIGSGLTGYYFDNPDFTMLKMTRTDANVNFRWGGGMPEGSNLSSSETFSVRWLGKLQAPVTGRYRLITTSDDGVRLFINNQPILDHWSDHAATDDEGVIDLIAGAFYDIRLEFYENGGDAVIQLFWSYPGQSRQIVPTARLFPVGP